METIILQAEHNGHGIRDAKWSDLYEITVPGYAQFGSSPKCRCRRCFGPPPRGGSAIQPAYTMLSWLGYIILGLAAFKHDSGLPHDRVHNEVEAVEGMIRLVREGRR